MFRFKNVFFCFWRRINFQNIKKIWFSQIKILSEGKGKSNLEFDDTLFKAQEIPFFCDTYESHEFGFSSALKSEATSISLFSSLVRRAKGVSLFSSQNLFHYPPIFSPLRPPESFPSQKCLSCASLGLFDSLSLYLTLFLSLTISLSVCLSVRPSVRLSLFASNSE